VKLHLFSSDEPLVAGQNQDAACGETVPKAAFLFRFDMGSTGAATVSNLLCCQKCAAKLKGGRSKRYLYALGNGEEALHEGQG
jgi:hypothetical protein